MNYSQFYKLYYENADNMRYKLKTPEGEIIECRDDAELDMVLAKVPDGTKVYKKYTTGDFGEFKSMTSFNFMFVKRAHD